MLRDKQKNKILDYSGYSYAISNERIEMRRR